MSMPSGSHLKKKLTIGWHPHPGDISKKNDNRMRVVIFFGNVTHMAYSSGCLVFGNVTRMGCHPVVNSK